MKGIAANAEVSKAVLLCIVNTCTVTQKSEQKARRIIRLLLKKFPNALVLVTGCYAQLNSLEINAIDSRIITLGGQVKSRIKLIPQRLRFLLENELLNPLALKQIINEEFVLPPQIKPNFPENSFELSTSSFIAHSRASLKIQDGCNNNCSYCAIHMARGFSVSLPVEDAVKRVQDWSKKVFKKLLLQQ
jgi:threonylcarbamoyladenosine tRNA methylthiotransferase MtaB